MVLLSVEERLEGATIRIGNDYNRHNPMCSSSITSAQIEDGDIITVECDIAGRYISITLPGTEKLSICEVRAFKGDCTEGTIII